MNGKIKNGRLYLLIIFKYNYDICFIDIGIMKNISINYFSIIIIIIIKFDWVYIIRKNDIK